MSQVDVPTGPAPLDPTEPSGGRRTTVAKLLVVALIAGFVSFWTWALFFASKESVNRIDDRAWAERAEEVCARANADREELADYRRVDGSDLDLLRERADLIDRSTDIVERMLDEVVAVTPTDPKGADIVPMWEADYRIFIQNRRDYAAITRGGADEPFRQARVDSVPISERIQRFTIDNEMRSCAPPRDL